VAVVVALLVGLVQGTIGLKDFPAMLAASARVNGVILPIIGVAILFAQALAVLNIPQGFVESLVALTADKTMLILIMLLIFLLAGMFMECTPNILILAPLLYPVAQKIGMDPIQFCVFMITALGLGSSPRRWDSTCSSYRAHRRAHHENRALLLPLRDNDDADLDADRLRARAIARAHQALGEQRQTAPRPFLIGRQRVTPTAPACRSR
jgi:hypothetical protein